MSTVTFVFFVKGFSLFMDPKSSTYNLVYFGGYPKNPKKKNNFFLFS